jgi:hypothetical protein
MTATPQQPIEIPLGGGPSQATGRLLRGPNVLEFNANADHDKAGYLVKARGFTRIALTTTTHGETPEIAFLSVGTDAQGELALVGVRDVYGVAANAPNVDGAALVLRGPALNGNYRAGVIHVSAIGVET